MVQRVKLPDGRIAEFPDNASQEQIESAARQVAQEEKGGSEKELPEFGSLPQFGPTGEKAATGAKLGLGFFTTPDTESRKDMIRQAIPGTEFAEDENGNTIIDLPSGQRAYLNKPGFSLQDFTDFASDVVKFVPSARFAAGAKSLLGVASRGAAGGAATSVAEDVGAMAQGSEQGVQLDKAAMTAATDVAGEGVGRVLSASSRGVGRILRRTFGRRTGDAFDEAGNLSKPARKSLERAGINPEEVTPEMAREAFRASKEGVPSEAVGGVAVARRFGVPLSRGNITGDYRQQAIEEDLAGQTGKGGDIVREAEQRRQSKTVEAARDVEENLGGGQQSLGAKPTAEAGGRIGEQVQSEAEALDQAIQDAFENASDKNARLTREGLDRLANAAQTIRESDDAFLDSNLTPATMRALEDIETLTGKDASGVTLERIEKVRRRINQAQEAAKNNADRRGVTRVKRAFDQYLDDAFDNALYEGDEDALKALKEARGLRAEYGRRFEQRSGRTRSGRKKRDKGGKVVESIVEDQPTNEEVTNMIFGRSKVFNTENASRAIDAIRRATNNDAQVNNTLKQMTFRRITDDAVDEGKFKPQTFVNRFDQFKKENETLYKKIFSEDERKALNEFRDVVNRQIKPGRVVNSSRTAQTLVRLLGRAGVATGLQTGGLGSGMLGGSAGRGIGRIIQAGAERAAAEDIVNPQFMLPGQPSALTISSAIAGVRGEDIREESSKAAQEIPAGVAEALTGQTAEKEQNGPQQGNTRQ